MPLLDQVQSVCKTSDVVNINKPEVKCSLLDQAIKKPDVWWNVLGHKLICEAQETINSYQFPWCSNEIIKLEKKQIWTLSMFYIKTLVQDVHVNL